MASERETAMTHLQRFLLMVVANACLFGGLLLAATSLVLWEMGWAAPGGDLENWAISGCFLCVFALVLGTIIRIHDLNRRIILLENRMAETLVEGAETANEEREPAA